MKTAVKRAVKRWVARGLVRVGGWERALERWARRGETLVLTYHRVLEKLDATLDYSQPGMIVTVPAFERQLAFLQRSFDIVALGDLLDGRPRRRPRCVITFDDGWRDNHDVAMPILWRRGIPATVFLTTDFIGTARVFWHTELIALLMHGDLTALRRDVAVLADHPRAVQDCLRQCVAAAPVPHAAEVDAVVETVKAHCEEDEIDRLLTTLARTAGLSRPLPPGRRFFLDWHQVDAMAASGFEIGSHGCSHRILTRVPVDHAHNELVRSRHEIERRTGRTVKHFAFPNEDANPELVALAAKAGYQTVCVGAAGAAAPSDVRALRRVCLHQGVGGAGARHDDALFALGLLRASRSLRS